MNILVVGSGGREHALAWKLSLSSSVEKVHVYPGNVGMLVEAKVVLAKFAVGADFVTMENYCRHHHITLIVVGSETYLAQGIANYFAATNIALLGPTQEAAQLETSKIFAKKIMQEAEIPTALYGHFTREEYSPALSFTEHLPWQEKQEGASDGGMVIKADALAAGKGVWVCEDQIDGKEALYHLMQNPACSVQAQQVLIEERLRGRELSLFALCDGVDFIMLGNACDYKRLGEGDTGPNTGGMGAYAPAPWVSENFLQDCARRIFSPCLRVMREKGMPFCGFLYAGLMVQEQEQDFKVLEFNVRLGDPETQALLPLLTVDVAPLFMAAATGQLAQWKLQQQQQHILSGQSSVHVVMTSKGYPGVLGEKVRTGDAIARDEVICQASLEKEEVKVFYAGVAPAVGDEKIASEALQTKLMTKLITSGGRVLGVTAVAQDLGQAKARAYAAIERIKFADAYYRRDIATGLAGFGRGMEDSL